jgi:acylphosphatase
MKHLTIKVFGTVQGVYYRHSAQQRAHELGIAGTAWNEDDGTVMVEAEGDEDSLAAFVEWCKRGSSSAKVDRVETTEGPVEEYSTFQLLRK